MKAKKVKIQSEHYPNVVDLVHVILDVDHAREVIENVTGLTYTNAEFTQPSHVVDFAQKVFSAEYTDFEEDDVEVAISVVLATEIAEIINGDVYFAVNEGVDIDKEEPYSEIHEVEGTIFDYVVYSKTPNGDLVYETDKIVEHLLAGGESYDEFIVGVEPVRRKRFQKKKESAPATKLELQAQLQQAIEVENYELAGVIRDKLNQLNC